MKYHDRLLVVATIALCVVSVVGPLFAGYCFKCEDQGKCESGCTPIRTDSTHPICDECRHTRENDCPEGYYCCTACVWRHYDCKKGPNYSIQCSDPPYISKVDSEDNERNARRPVKCSSDKRKCVEQ